eukprot:11035801-Lingulodinium_polyedra.AAC.1
MAACTSFRRTLHRPASAIALLIAPANPFPAAASSSHSCRSSSSTRRSRNVSPPCPLRTSACWY